jgi:adenosine deaminase
MATKRDADVAQEIDQLKRIVAKLAKKEKVLPQCIRIKNKVINLDNVTDITIHPDRIIFKYNYSESGDDPGQDEYKVGKFIKRADFDKIVAWVNSIKAERIL